MHNSCSLKKNRVEQPDAKREHCYASLQNHLHRLLVLQRTLKASFFSVNRTNKKKNQELFLQRTNPSRPLIQTELVFIYIQEKDSLLKLKIKNKNPLKNFYLVKHLTGRCEL